MTWRDALPRLGVLLGYAALALVFTWPLPIHLSTHLTGDPGGDTGVYVWNQWVFQHEARAGANPLSTEQILSLSERVDLSQHNYTAFLDLLALPLMPWLGVVSTFNIVLLLATVLTALCTSALARRAFETTRFEGFLAGLAFAWSPVLVARSTGHFSLVAAAPLPAFVWCLVNAERSRSLVYAALAGLSMAWAAFCDAYYAIYCLLIGGLYVTSSVLVVSRRERLSRVPWRWLVDVLILSFAGLVVGLALGRGANVEVFGLALSVRGLYTPVLVLTLLIALRVALLFRARLEGLSEGLRWLKPALVATLACAGPLSPVLYGLGQRIVDGRYVDPPIYWRSSPRGVDLLAYLHPNPNAAWSRWLLGDGQAAAPTPYVEFTAALSLVAVATIAFAVWRAGFRPRPGWWWLTIGFAALALGPFVIVAGENTYVPGPWALLRYVPIIGAARSPTRFSIVAALGVAILLAGAVAAIGRRWPERRRLAGSLVLLLLLVELCPAPRTLYSAAISPIYDVIAADPRPVRVLSLPFGVRDGLSSAGNFSARYQFNQTRHQKKLIGGYLSRVSRTRLETMRREHPTLDKLLVLSEGGSLGGDDRQALLDEGPGFVARSNLGYVVIDAGMVTPELASLAIQAWTLEPIASDGALTLYRPRP